MLVHIQGVLIPSTTTFQKEFFSETHITEYSKSKTTTQGLDFDANQRIDSRRDSRHTIAARIKVDSRERYHD